MKDGAYSFQVVATLKGHESSLPSEILNVVLCPNPPRLINVEDRRETSVVLTWDHHKVKSTNNTMYEYVIDFAVDNNNNNNGNYQWNTIRTQHKGVLIQSLMRGQSYVARVRIQTKICVSESSEKVRFTTSYNQTIESSLEERMKDFAEHVENQTSRVQQSMGMIQNFTQEMFKSQTNQMMNHTSNMIENLKIELLKEIEANTERSTGCKWTMGDGIGRIELALNGEYENKWDCYRACIKKSGHKRHQAINGVTYGIRDKYNKKCFCEKQMRSIDGLDNNFMTCRFAPIYDFKNEKDNNN